MAAERGTRTATAANPHFCYPQANQVLVLNNERFMVPELLFHPSGKLGGTWEMEALPVGLQVSLLQDRRCAAGRDRSGQHTSSCQSLNTGVLM